jgi:hypothetical protein
MRTTFAARALMIAAIASGVEAHWALPDDGAIAGHDAQMGIFLRGVQPDKLFHR